MKALPLSDDEIERRTQLWDALSNLYLDTENPDFVSFVVSAARRGGLA